MTARGIDPNAQEVKGALGARANAIVELRGINLSQAQRPKKQLQNHPLVVEGMLQRDALRGDLIEDRFVQQLRTKLLPSRRIFKLGIERSGGPEADGLADQVIAALRARIAQSLRGSPGMGGDHRNKQGDSVLSRGRRIDKCMQGE